MSAGPCPKCNSKYPAVRGAVYKANVYSQLEIGATEPCRNEAFHGIVASIRHPMPWDPHEHAPHTKDADGNVLCFCTLILSGPVANEAKEILAALNKAAQQGGGRG